MKISVENRFSASRGDVIEFNHSGSKNLCSHYLICYSNTNGYFIINLSGEKTGEIKFYKQLNTLIDYHSECIVKIYSKREWQMKLSRCD
jgi:hypothetical protein